MPAEPPTTEAEPTPEATAEPAYAEVIRISVWWSTSPFSDVSSNYVHFKAVDEDGETVTQLPLRLRYSVDLGGGGRRARGEPQRPA